MSWVAFSRGSFREIGRICVRLRIYGAECTFESRDRISLTLIKKSIDFVSEASETDASYNNGGLHCSGGGLRVRKYTTVSQRQSVWASRNGKSLFMEWSTMVQICVPRTQYKGILVVQTSPQID